MRYQILSNYGSCAGSSDDLFDAVDKCEELNSIRASMFDTFYEVFDTETSEYQ